jgi:ribosome-associated toxin RatA of RatAB toxin-antitoxin module
MDESKFGWRRVVRGLTLLCLCGLLAVAGVVVAPAGAQAGTTAPVSAEIAGGGIESTGHPYPGTSTEWGRAVALVDAPYDRVVKAVENYGSYKDFLPNFTASKVLSQRGSSALLYAQVSVMKGAATIWAELKIKARTEGTARIIEAKMTKGNVDILQATWHVTPYDATHTLVAFQIIVDPDLPLPSSLVNSENRKTARKTIRALRARLVAPAAPVAAAKK